MSFADLAADTAVRADPEVAGPLSHRRCRTAGTTCCRRGGVVMTAALRAAEAHVGDPRAAARLGDDDLRVADPSRRAGRRRSRDPARRQRPRRCGCSCATSLEKSGEPGLELVATFMRERKGPDVIGVAFPSVERVADAIAGGGRRAEQPAHAVPLLSPARVPDRRRRARSGPADFAAGPARYARWFRYRVPQRDPEGRFDRLALPPLIDTMPTALHRAIGPGPYRFYAPSLDLTVLRRRRHDARVASRRCNHAARAGGVGDRGCRGVG